MNIRPIVVILDTQEVHTPQQIVFKTVFVLDEPHLVTDDLALMNERFLSFLTENSLEYSDSQQTDITINDLTYTCPSYLIPLTYPTYLLVEHYRDTHPELSGHVVSRIVSQEDVDSFLQNLSMKARQLAEEKAQKQGLFLGEGFEMEEVKIATKGWVVHSPLRSRFNHFRQALGGHYKFYFSAKPL